VNDNRQRQVVHGNRPDCLAASLHHRVLDGLYGSRLHGLAGGLGGDPRAHTAQYFVLRRSPSLRSFPDATARAAAFDQRGFVMPSVLRVASPDEPGCERRYLMMRSMVDAPSTAVWPPVVPATAFGGGTWFEMAGAVFLGRPGPRFGASGVSRRMSAKDPDDWTAVRMASVRVAARVSSWVRRAFGMGAASVLTAPRRAQPSSRRIRCAERVSFADAGRVCMGRRPRRLRRTQPARRRRRTERRRA
jgi:hypothetical protein